MEAMEGYETTLTFNEAILLSDSLSMFSTGPNQGSHAYPDLLLKVGGAFMDTGPDKPPARVMFSREELWMIREVAKSPISIGSERVGLNLLRKVYAGLLRLSAYDFVHDAVAQVGETTGSEDAPSKAESKQKIDQWLGQINSKEGDKDGGHDHYSDADKDNPSHKAPA